MNFDMNPQPPADLDWVVIYNPYETIAPKQVVVLPTGDKAQADANGHIVIRRSSLRWMQSNGWEPVKGQQQSDAMLAREKSFDRERMTLMKLALRRPLDARTLEKLGKHQQIMKHASRADLGAMLRARLRS